MRWVLPGGAILNVGNHGSDQRAVACRPLAAVLERSSPCPLAASTQAEMNSTKAPTQQATGPPLLDPLLTQTEPSLTTAAGSFPDPSRQKLTGRLSIVKLILEVLAVLVGLITAILALLSGSRK